MIRAYILIETSSGKEYKYVRDVVTDNLGVAPHYYGYRGNGYQDFGVTIPGEMKDTGLLWDTTYSVNINVDGGGAVEYTMTFPSPNEKFGNTNKRGPQVRWHELVEKLSLFGEQGGFEVDIVDNDIRIRSNGAGAGTSIAITAGTTGADLLTELGTTPPAAVVADAYDDQAASAGKISNDYGSLVTSWTGAAGLLQFPDSTPATTLRRRNLLNGQDDNTDTIVQIIKSQIVAIKVIEEIVEDVVNKP